MKAQAIGVALAVLVAIGVAYAGSNGVGTGGLQGFPAGQNVSGSGSQIGPGCVTTATGIECTTGTFGFADAGIVKAAAVHFTTGGAVRCEVTGGNTITCTAVGGLVVPSLSSSGTNTLSGATALNLTATTSGLFCNNAAATVCRSESSMSAANMSISNAANTVQATNVGDDDDTYFGVRGGVSGAHGQQVGITGEGKFVFNNDGGAAEVAGRAVLVAGTVTVSTTAVEATSLIQLTRCVTGGTEGHLSVGTVTADTSFVINSSSGSDTSTICWWLAEQAL